MLFATVVVALARVQVFRFKRCVEKASSPVRTKYLPKLQRLEERQAKIELFWFLALLVLWWAAMWGPDWMFVPIGEWLGTKSHS